MRKGDRVVRLHQDYWARGSGPRRPPRDAGDNDPEKETRLRALERYFAEGGEGYKQAIEELRVMAAKQVHYTKIAHALGWEVEELVRVARKHRISMRSAGIRNLRFGWGSKRNKENVDTP